MSRQSLLIRVLAVGLVAFSAGVWGAMTAPVSANAEDSFEIIKTEEFEGVIFPRQKGKDFVRAFTGADEREFWTPSRANVLRLERKIEAYLKKAAARRSPNLWSKLSTYKRQYAGFVRNGRRMIFANFFCESLNTDWKTTPIAVADGGDCFFNVLYDVDSATFSDLQINGEA